MHIDPFIDQTKELKREMRRRTISYIAGAFGLVAGLAWNDAIKSLIDFVFPLSGNTIIAKFIYALGMTFIIVFIVLIIEHRFVRKIKK